MGNRWGNGGGWLEERWRGGGGVGEMWGDMQEVWRRGGAQVSRGDVEERWGRGGGEVEEAWEERWGFNQNTYYGGYGYVPAISSLHDGVTEPADEDQPDDHYSRTFITFFVSSSKYLIN